MAEWQYRIQRVELQPGDDLDEQLVTSLETYGQKGWELVQVLEKEPSPPTYRIIFKAPKPLD